MSVKTVVSVNRNRYPGPHPFSDDDFSRKVFFGRDEAARRLTDKILANHLVTVYARSGVGKTSVLQAGVAQLLRTEGYFPLFVRVNDRRIGPLQALVETITAEAQRQDVEYIPGRSGSLWGFFKTAEFWLDERLLTPVLILDQFEELFTLQDEEARGRFLDELSYLLRGVRPPPGEEMPPGEELSPHPPAVHVVLSLREDYLAYLEEASEHIPQILDARFRLAPLDLDSATEAIIRPASIADPDLETGPFAVDHTAVEAIVDFLCQDRRAVLGDTRRYVEPIQLQVVCQRMEAIAEARQKASPGCLTITMADLGGEAGLTLILRDYYRNAIGSVRGWLARRRSRRLFKDLLISPGGRRLSQDENEIRRQVHLRGEALASLVESRLLRSDNRSDSVYYELSHDALIEPVLASSLARDQVMGMLAVISGALLVLVSLPLFLYSIYDTYTYMDDRVTVLTTYHASAIEISVNVMFQCMFILGLLVVVVLSAMLLRGGSRLILRYDRGLRPGANDPEMNLWSRLLAGLPALAAAALVALIGAVLLFMLTLIVLGEWARQAARWLDDGVGSIEAYVEHRVEHGVGLDTLVNLVIGVTMFAIAWRLCRWGIYRLAGIRGIRALPAPTTPGRSAVQYAAARMLFGGIVLLSAIVLVGLDVLTWQCHRVPGPLPDWLANRLNVLSVDCIAGSPDAVFEISGDLVILTALLVVAIPALRRGIVAARTAFPSARRASARAPQFGRPVPERSTDIAHEIDCSA